MEMPLKIRLNSSVQLRHVYGVHDSINFTNILGREVPRTSMDWHPYDLPADHYKSVNYTVVEPDEAPCDIEKPIVVSFNGEIDDYVICGHLEDAHWSPYRILCWFNHITTNLPRVTSAILDVQFELEDNTMQATFWLDVNSQQILFFTEYEEVKEALCEPV